jgi:phage-related tail protein
LYSATKEFGQARKEFCRLGKEFGSATKESCLATKEFGQAGKEFDRLRKEFDSATKESCRVRKEFGQAGKEFDRLRKEFGRVQLLSNRAAMKPFSRELLGVLAAFLEVLRRVEIMLLKLDCPQYPVER